MLLDAYDAAGIQITRLSQRIEELIAALPVATVWLPTVSPVPVRDRPGRTRAARPGPSG